MSRYPLVAAGSLHANATRTATRLRTRKMTTRAASHAGSWYPASSQSERALRMMAWTQLKTALDPFDAEERLAGELERWLGEAHTPAGEGADADEPWMSVCMPAPLEDCRAIIAPHAGYAYSGRAAAWAYKLIDPAQIKRVFILGPAHHVYLNCCALTKCTDYETPLGNLPVDTAINEELKALKGGTALFSEMDLTTDEEEHSIELHLPYIRHVFKDQDIKIVPILVGSLRAAEEREYGALLAAYLADRQSLFVVSSDFCHWGQRFSYTYYRDPSTGAPAETLGARSAAPGLLPIHASIARLDRAAMEAIELPDPAAAHAHFAGHLKETRNTICGRHPIGLLLAAMAALHASSPAIAQELQFVRYEQSGKCLTAKDSSVSYASAFLRHPA
ncbi:hypothetical protein PtA15_3A115 [Puccinia triticina]|uniref:AmmeMemoRadiSam system protein B n=1 Tax=Puccinia triticina TaxID=208348 RepID=A0ABY7CF28_9BASI|nr:uncharacterized protein PtA15_3A115 [Puccinia triticina]WAQ82751.1 hypothetical protein PtA15_3A115 [Puccinia triticina]